MTHRTRFIIMTLWAYLLGASVSWAADLQIHVTGFSSGDGDLHYSLYADPGHFPTREGRIAKGQVKARAGGVTVVIRDLAPGTYAVALFHDENGNDEFDQGFLGIPLEDYGFSNNVTVFFGPPSFAEVAFELDDKGTRITIHLD